MSAAYQCDRCRGLQADYTLSRPNVNVRNKSNYPMVYQYTSYEPVVYDLCATCKDAFQKLVTDFFKQTT